MTHPRHFGLFDPLPAFPAGLLNIRRSAFPCMSGATSPMVSAQRAHPLIRPGETSLVDGVRAGSIVAGITSSSGEEDAERRQ
jgi:hypothetical protein